MLKNFGIVHQILFLCFQVRVGADFIGKESSLKKFYLAIYSTQSTSIIALVLKHRTCMQWDRSARILLLGYRKEAYVQQRKSEMRRRKRYISRNPKQSYQRTNFYLSVSLILCYMYLRSKNILYICSFVND